MADLAEAVAARRLTLSQSEQSAELVERELPVKVTMVATLLRLELPRLQPQALAVVVQARLAVTQALQTIALRLPAVPVRQVASRERASLTPLAAMAKQTPPAVHLVRRIPAMAAVAA
jgi:hypothetical protein